MTVGVATSATDIAAGFVWTGFPGVEERFEGRLVLVLRTETFAAETTFGDWLLLVPGSATFDDKVIVENGLLLEPATVWGKTTGLFAATTTVDVVCLIVKDVAVIDLVWVGAKDVLVVDLVWVRVKYVPDILFAAKAIGWEVGGIWAKAAPTAEEKKLPRALDDIFLEYRQRWLRVLRLGMCQFLRL